MPPHRTADNDDKSAIDFVRKAVREEMSQSDYKSRLANNRRERVMALIESLPLVPTSVHVPARILQLYRNPNSPPLEHFADILVADGPLSAKVLELANSAWFCPTRPVTRVSDAIRMIGLKNLMPLLFGLSLAGMLNKADLPADERAALWQTSLLKGIIAREWAKWREVDRQEEAFLCGVLQDIAMPAMIAGDRSSSMELAGVINLGEEERLQRESALYGVDHCEFGRILCQKMQLPELYATAVASHHAVDGPVLPEEFRGITGGLQLAALLPHGMMRLDDHGGRRLAECFARVTPKTGPKEFSEFIRLATQSATALMSVLAPAANSKLAMKTFLQDVSDQIARSLFAAIGNATHMIDELQTSRQELEKKVHELCDQVARADYDSLTNVLNRHSLLERAEKLIALARQHKMHCVAGFLDLCDLKGINERFGEEVGDHALIVAADALRRMIQNRGMVGRFGGDEFVFVMVLPPQHGHDVVDQEIKAALGNLSVSADGNQVDVASNVGIASLGLPAENMHIQDAIRLANHQMHALNQPVRAECPAI